MFEIELIICIKVDLALNNLLRLICHKTHQTKPNQTKQFSVILMSSNPFWDEVLIPCRGYNQCILSPHWLGWNRKIGVIYSELKSVINHAYCKVIPNFMATYFNHSFKVTPPHQKKKRRKKKKYKSSKEMKVIFRSVEIKYIEKKFRQNYVILFTNPSARAGYDTRSIFKRSLTDLNSEFSFS